MKCTKCSGSGSEGFISFLRCGRCGGTGDEPKGALVPYSPELIVVPEGPVLTGRAAEADVASSKKTDPAAVTKAVEDEAYNRRVEELAERACAGKLNRGWGAAFNNGPSINNAAPAEPPEKKEAPLLHGTQCIDIETKPDASADAVFDLDFIWSQTSPNEANAFVKQVLFETKYRYLIEMYYQGKPMIGDFYTGLGLPAIPASDCQLNLFAEPKMVFKLKCIERSEEHISITDRIIVTLMFEFRAIESRIYHRGVYPMGGTSYGYGPGYGQR